MGDDDANVGGPGECPGHDFSLESLVLVQEPGRLLPGLGQSRVCRWCGIPDYQASSVEQG